MKYSQFVLNGRWIFSREWLLNLVCIYVFVMLVIEDCLSCSPGLNTPGWTIPKGDIILEHGQPLEILCILNGTVTKTANATNISFYRGKENIPSQYVTVINETVAKLLIPHPPPSIDMYYCKLKGDEFLVSNNYTPTSLEASTSSQAYDYDTVVCLNSVAVGTKPIEVKNVSCTSYNWEQLVCSWVPPLNYIKTNYKVYYYTPGRPGRRILYPCPNADDIQYNNCTWNANTDPLYRRTFEYLFFTIIGENVLGNLSTSVRFHHYAHIIPSKPTNLRIIDKTISSVLLQWSIGLLSIFEKGLIFKIEYTWNKSAPWTVAIVSHKEVQKVNDEIKLNVTNLRYPNTAYDFRLYMKSSVANGDNTWSEPATTVVKTKPCAPFIPPKIDVGSFEISHLYRTYRDIYLYWQPLMRSEQNGEDFHYEVTAIEGGKISEVKPTLVTYSYAKFSGMGFHSYHFLIQSVNKEGSSSPSKLFVPPSENSIEEPDFTKIDFGDGVYELSWKFASRIKDITNFTVFWCENNRERPYQCDGYLNWTHLHPEINIYNITLNKHKAYQFAISVNTEDSSSGMVWASCTVLHNKIGKMNNVWVNKIGQDFIELGWKLECSDRIEGIKGYQIFYCPTISPSNNSCKDPEQNVTIVGDSSTARGNITYLKPYTSYKISIAVFTKDGGLGPRSDELFNHTLEGAPDVDDMDVTVYNITNTTITLYWTCPKSMNGVFQYYKIQYNEREELTNMTKITLFKLSCYTIYNISIRTCTQKCSKEFKIPPTRTKIGIPGPVGSLTAKKINTSFARVTWQLPIVKSGPFNTYDVLVLHDDLDQNSTVHEFETNNTEAEVSIPNCKNEKIRSSYTFYVRAKTKNFTSIGKPDMYIGDWSQAYTINCIQSSISLSFKLLIYFLLFVFVIIFIFGGRMSFYKCKKMKEVQVTLPPNFTIPALFDNVKDIEYRINSDTWNQKNELDRLNTKLSETDCDDDMEHTALDEITRDNNFDTDPYSSGCCTGRNSTTSSITGGTQTSDSGTEMESKMAHLSLLCDDSNQHGSFLITDGPIKWDIKESPISLSDCNGGSWMDCYSPMLDNSALNKITPGYIALQNITTLPNCDSTDVVQTNNNGYVSFTPKDDFPPGYSRVTF